MIGSVSPLATITGDASVEPPRVCRRLFCVDRITVTGVENRVGTNHTARATPGRATVRAIFASSETRPEGIRRRCARRRPPTTPRACGLMTDRTARVVRSLEDRLQGSMDGLPARVALVIILGSPGRDRHRWSCRRTAQCRWPEALRWLPPALRRVQEGWNRQPAVSASPFLNRKPGLLHRARRNSFSRREDIPLERNPSGADRFPGQGIYRQARSRPTRMRQASDKDIPD